MGSGSSLSHEKQRVCGNIQPLTVYVRSSQAVYHRQVAADKMAYQRMLQPAARISPPGCCVAHKWEWHCTSSASNLRDACNTVDVVPLDAAKRNVE